MNSLTMPLQIEILILLPMMLISSFTRTESLALPGCPGECGNLSIPFPFGITSNCYLDESFLIICNFSFNPPKPFLQQGHAEVLNISLDGKIKILNSSSELMELEKRGNESVPVVIEWAAGKIPCHVARNNKTVYTCLSEHSKCTDSTSGLGHICHCLPGYEGNPYLLDGCKDIDDCVAVDGRKARPGCYTKDQATWSASIFFLGILVLPTMAGTWILWNHQEKRLLKYRKYFFEQNGGNLLLKKVSKLKDPAMKNIRIYTADETRKATNNYRNKMEYKCTQAPCFFGRVAGSDDRETEVLIMQIPIVPKPHINQFIDQLIILSKPHENLVKIIGCCLETENPLLVYEFREERTCLFDHVHDEGTVLYLSCEQRVKAAEAAARALEYLHFDRSIVHGNVSSANILLDGSSGTKLFFVVASNLIPQKPLSPEQESNIHRPPEFSTSLQLNQKVDVYSFGKVLAELLTGWKSDYIISEQQVKEKIATLAGKCLSMKPEERPNMKSVVSELSKLMHAPDMKQNL